jgi:ATP-binding protein involved in chromosome partitioning
MSYLACPNCKEKINIFGKGGGQKISEQFNIPFIGEIPLTSQIMQGSDEGKSIIISEPNSEYSQAFYKISKITAGRISVVALELHDQEDKEKEKITQ